MLGLTQEVKLSCIIQHYISTFYYLHVIMRRFAGNDLARSTPRQPIYIPWTKSQLTCLAAGTLLFITMM